MHLAHKTWGTVPGGAYHARASSLWSTYGATVVERARDRNAQHSDPSGQIQRFHLAVDDRDERGEIDVVESISSMTAGPRTASRLGKVTAMVDGNVDESAGFGEIHLAVAIAA